MWPRLQSDSAGHCARIMSCPEESGLNIQSTGVVDREFIGKSIEQLRFGFAIYGTWEALGGCNRGVGTIC